MQICSKHTLRADKCGLLVGGDGEREGERDRWGEGIRGERYMWGKHNHTYRTRFHPGVPGAPPLVEVCPSLSLGKKYLSRLSGMPGGPVCPVSARSNLLQTQLLLPMRNVQSFTVWAEKKKKQPKAEQKGILRLFVCVRACVFLYTPKRTFDLRTCASGVSSPVSKD